MNSRPGGDGWCRLVVRRRPNQVIRDTRVRTVTPHSEPFRLVCDHRVTTPLPMRAAETGCSPRHTGGPGHPGQGLITALSSSQGIESRAGRRRRTLGSRCGPGLACGSARESRGGRERSRRFQVAALMLDVEVEVVTMAAPCDVVHPAASLRTVDPVRSIVHLCQAEGGFGGRIPTRPRAHRSSRSCPAWSALGTRTPPRWRRSSR